MIKTNLMNSLSYSTSQNTLSTPLSLAVYPNTQQLPLERNENGTESRTSIVINCCM